jgi:hypothetical protein
MSNDETTTTTRGNEKDNQKLPQAFSKDRCSIRSGYSVVQKSNQRLLSRLDGAGPQVARIFITKLFPATRLDWMG